MAITLEENGNRFKEFLRINSHLNITPFQAIKGAELSKHEITSQGLATEELTATSLLTSGTAGCAASHRKVWKDCAISKTGTFIMEDDCYTHPEINDFINTHINSLMASDICFFGINTDSILQSTSPQGLTTLRLFEPKHPTAEWISNAFKKTDIKNTQLHSLAKAFGFCAYFISPQGAKRLEELIFPLSLKTTNIPLITDRMPAFSIDRSGCAIYHKMSATVCQPFLAYTPNTDSSTIEE